MDIVNSYQQQMAYQHNMGSKMNQVDSFFTNNRQGSIERIESKDNHQSILRKLSLMKRVSSDRISNGDGVSFKRAASILRPTLQASLLRDNSGSFVLPSKSPQMNGFAQTSFYQTPVNAGSTPLGRLFHAKSIISLAGEPAATSATVKRQPSILDALRLPLTPTNIDNTKSPELDMKEYKVNGIPIAIDSKTFYGNSAQVNTPTRNTPRLPKIESSLSIKKMLHSLISLSSMHIDQNNVPIKFKPSNNIQEDILDQQDNVEDENKEESKQSICNTRTSKSGPNRNPIEVVEQESELTKVTYNVGDDKKSVYIAGLGLIDDYMASDNLNECVDYLLQKKSKAAFHQHAEAIELAAKRSMQNSPRNGLSTGANTPANQKQLATGFIPRVVIRHRVKGAKKAQKRLRKNGEQNKILMAEFQKNPVWQKAKIIELQNLLGLKQSQIYKWNWDMSRKQQSDQDAEQVSAPDISEIVNNSEEQDSQMSDEEEF